MAWKANYLALLPIIQIIEFAYSWKLIKHKKTEKQILEKLGVYAQNHLYHICLQTHDAERSINWILWKCSKTLESHIRMIL